MASTPPATTSLLTPPPQALRVHLTNVAGTGAIQLVKSLLPALEADASCSITHIFLPARGILSEYKPSRQDIAITRYRRWLPNSISRFLECTLLTRHLTGSTSILVLGDIPLRCRAPQVVLVHTPHLLPSTDGQRPIGASTKYAVARWLFRINAKFAHAFIVQTTAMRDSLATAYPHIADRIHVIAQPAPTWLLSAPPPPYIRRLNERHPLRLIYPAAGYPHKNHALLSKVQDEARDWPIERLTLTIPPTRNPAPAVQWIYCTGALSDAGMLEAYATHNGLLFLSKAESYGLPLIEAMHLGLPIICPALPYARTLCGDQAIYFDPDSPHSLKAAVAQLATRVANGWLPDWTPRLRSIPASWSSVASAIVQLLPNKTGSSEPPRTPGPAEATTGVAR
jgi:glycosyltransferase involved in cell wall biosynthesis